LGASPTAWDKTNKIQITMLELTGTLKNKVYNQEVVSSEQLAELTGAPKKIKGDEQHILEICPNLVKVTPEGQMNYPRGISQQGMTELQIDGDTVSLRYYKRKNQTGPGMFTYSPTHVEFKGLKNAYTAADYEQFLFLYLSSICKDSPSKPQDPMIQYHDALAIERNAVASSEQLEQMLEIIQKAPNTDILAKSRGILLNGIGTNVPQGAGVGMHRAALIGLLVKYQAAFCAEWYNDSVFVRGLAREAMYTGGVKQKQVGNRQAWVWGSNDTTILFIPDGADPFTELVSWCISAENTEYAKSALTLAVTGQPQRKPELHPSTPPDTDGQVSEIRLLLNAGIAKGVVWREEETNRMMYQGQQGEVETRVCALPDWVGNLETFLKTPGKQNHLAAIKAAVANN
jgi:hypothetical protein